MNAVIYCRVSTEKQTENLSLPTQEKACRIWCSAHGVNVLKVFTDAGRSAKNLNRVQFREMTEYCRLQKRASQPVHYVVVYSMSRFSRDVYDTAIARSLLSKYGVEVRSATEGVDDSPTGQLMGNLAAALAQFENQVKAERTRAGMTEAAARGRFPHKAPLGYLNVQTAGDDPNLVADPETAPYILQGFQMYANGSQSITAVLAKLTAQGLRTKKGVPVSPQTFNAILKNPIYKGQIELPRWGVKYDGSFQPIVSSDLFDRVQFKLSGKSSASAPRSRVNPNFPLRLFIRCSGCGVGLTGSIAKKKYGYYFCRESECRKVKVPKEHLEKAFLDLLFRVQFRPDHFALFREIVDSVWQQRREEYRGSEALARQEVQRLKERKQRLIDAVVDKVISQSVYEEQVEAVEEKLLFANAAVRDAEVDTLEIETLMRFAETALTEIGRMWLDADVEHRLVIQRVVFPEGLDYSADGGFGTPLTGCLFSSLGDVAEAIESLASPTGFEPVLPP
jgi:site-specific DNA recombinase